MHRPTDTRPVLQAGVAELPIWSEAGAAEYYADPVTLTIIMFILFNWAEVARYRDIKNPGYARVRVFF